MTEPYGYDEDPDDQDDNDSSEQHVRLTRAQIRTLERDAKTARKANDELTQTRRELALARAGVSDLTERQQRALLASIDGDVTADSVREAAVDLGFVQPPADAPAAAEQASMERMSQASAGATDPGSEDSIARLERAAAQGPEAFYAQIKADGGSVLSAG